MKHYYNMFGIAVLGLLMSVVSTDYALAQEISDAVETISIPTFMATDETFCINGLGKWGGYISTGIGVIVVAASTAANVVSKDTMLGKIVNFFAINFKVEKAK